MTGEWTEIYYLLSNFTTIYYLFYYLSDFTTLLPCRHPGLAQEKGLQAQAQANQAAFLSLSTSLNQKLNSILQARHPPAQQNTHPQEEVEAVDTSGAPDEARFSDHDEYTVPPLSGNIPPYNPSPLPLSPTLDSSAAPSPTDEAPGDATSAPPPPDKLYHFPEYASITEEGIYFGDSFVSFASSEIQTLQHQGQRIFKPLILSETVLALLEESNQIILRTDLKDEKREHFKTLSQAVNSMVYACYGWSTSSSSPLTFALDKVSQYVESIPTSNDPARPPTFRHIPFSMEAASSKCNPILTFASAPKLSNDCHKLSGILAGKTRDVPDDLRSKDFELHQLLLGLLLLHDNAKLSINITNDVLGKLCSYL